MNCQSLVYKRSAVRLLCLLNNLLVLVLCSAIQITRPQIKIYAVTIDDDTLQWPLECAERLPLD